MRENSFPLKAHSTITGFDHKISKYRFITGNTLKIIAISVMLFDHFCKIVLQWLLNNYWYDLYDVGQITWEQFSEIDNFVRFDLYAIGTIAFPLFCFLLSEGFHYTKNRKKYMGLMLVFAIISELPFDLGFFNELSIESGTYPFYWQYQNVFFTLFLGLVALDCIDKFSCNPANKINRTKSILLQVVSVAAIAIIAEVIRCDYGKEGVLFVVAFYIFRKNRLYQILLFLMAYMLTTGEQPTIYTMLSCLLILLYNGKRGKLKLKYFFYAFYPVHITIFYVVTLLLSTHLGQ